MAEEKVTKYELLSSMVWFENTIVVLTSDNGPVLDDGYKDDAVELEEIIR